MARSTALYRNKTELQARLREVPTCPGIYRFYDAGGALVYVGKSICLRDRVRSYFTGQAATKKLRRLRQEVSRLDWQATGSELEALLLESRLVKLHQPRFNVLLREFVALPYVRLDTRDPFPRLEVTRGPARDGATYFGPFRSQATLEAGVAALADALGLRDCPGSGASLRGKRACYRYELGTCSGPCLGAVTEWEYRRTVEQAGAVFDGRGQAVLTMLQARMERAAEQLRFETAARLRDAIRHIQAVSGRQQALLSAISELSLVAACPSRQSDRLCLFVFGSGRLVLNEEAALEDLQDPGSRREWASRLVAAREKGPDEECSAGSPLPALPARGPGEAQGRLDLDADEPAVRLDSALLDEIQIVTAWMKQRTREGAYWQFPAGTPPEQMVAQLDLWLAGCAQTGPLRLAA